MRSDFTIKHARATTFKSASTNYEMTRGELVDMINRATPIDDKRDGPIIHFGIFPDKAPKRLKSQCEGVTGYCFDYDERNGDNVTRKEAYEAAINHGVAAIFWDSFSSGGYDKTFRMIVLCNEPQPTDTYKNTCAAICEKLGITPPSDLLQVAQGFFFSPNAATKVRRSAASTPGTVFAENLVDPTTMPVDDDFEEDASGAYTDGTEELTAEQVSDAVVVINAMREGGHHLSNGQCVWHRVAQALCRYKQGAELFIAFSKGDKHFSERECLKKLRQKSRGHATSIAHLFAIAGELGIENPAAGRRPKAEDDFADDLFSAKPKEQKAPPQSTRRKLISMPDPFPGLHSELTKAILAASHVPQPNLANLCALIVMSVVGGFSSYADGTRVNLYGCELSDTGTGKEAPVECAQTAAISANSLVLSTPASGEALEDALLGGPLLVVIREAAHIFKVMSGDNAAPHAVSLARILLDLFSAGQRKYYSKRMKAGQDKPVIVNHPTLSLLMASTPAKLGEAMSTDNISDGMIGRMLFAEGDVGAERQRTPGKFVVPAQLEFFNMAGFEIVPTQMADDLMWEMTLGFDLERKRMIERDDFASAALLARRAEKVKRICGALAAAEDGTVTVQMVEWAVAFCKASDKVVLTFTEEHLDKNKDVRDTDKVLAAARGIMSGKIKPARGNQASLIKDGFIPRGLCLKASHLSKAKFDLAVEHLRDLGEILAGQHDGSFVLRLE